MYTSGHVEPSTFVHGQRKGRLHRKWLPPLPLHLQKLLFFILSVLLSVCSLVFWPVCLPYCWYVRPSNCQAFLLFFLLFVSPFSIFPSVCSEWLNLSNCQKLTPGHLSSKAILFFWIELNLEEWPFLYCF